MYLALSHDTLGQSVPVSRGTSMAVGGGGVCVGWGGGVLVSSAPALVPTNLCTQHVPVSRGTSLAVGGGVCEGYRILPDTWDMFKHVT